MNPQDPLAALHPLREPAAIGWWPPAPGWWMLAVLLLLVIAGLCGWLLHRHRRNRYRRTALVQQQALYANWLSSNDSGLFVAATNTLLKSVALRAYPRRDIARRNGHQWIDFLNHSMPESAQRPVFDQSFATAIYQSDTSALDCDAVFKSASYWISNHRVTR